MNPLRYSLNGGLGILRRDYVIDSRVSEKGREIRLIRTLLNTRSASGHFKGLGIDENTALIVENAMLHPVGRVTPKLWYLLRL